MHKDEIDDALIVALFPQIGWKFLENRGNPAAFEPAPTIEATKPATESKVEKPVSSVGSAVYTVELEGKAFVVKVSEGGDISNIAPVTAPTPVANPAPQATASGSGEPVNAPMAGNIIKVMVAEGQQVAEGDVLLILEVMKMETKICAAKAGAVQGIKVKSGDVVGVGDTLMQIA